MKILEESARSKQAGSVNTAIRIVVLPLLFLAAFQLSSCSNSDDKNYKVIRAEAIKEYGKSLDWHHGKDLITFGKRDAGGYYDVYVMRSDGRAERCLTCDKEDCPQKHNGNPAWHPSGDYIVFTAEKENNPWLLREWAIPGTGYNCNLWIMTSDGEEFYPLTDYPFLLSFTAVIHPHFSHDGKVLLWSERVKRGDSFGGGWVLKTADFVVKDTRPALENIRAYEPGEKPCFYEGHSFSNDDEKILFSGDLEYGQPPHGMDIHELTLKSGKFEKMTDTSEHWDEHSFFSPDGKMIAWMSSSGFDIRWGDVDKHDFHKTLMTDLWIMDADGSDKQRLTHFNTPGHPEYMDGVRTVVSDISWGPDSRTIAALLGYDKGPILLGTKILMIEFEVD